MRRLEIKLILVHLVESLVGLISIYVLLDKLLTAIRASSSLVRRAQTTVRSFRSLGNIPVIIVALIKVVT